MKVAVVKALCRRIEDRYGSNRFAAIAAGVSPSVWSDYCNDDKPTCTIPFGRLLMVANAEERVAFAELLTEATDCPPGDLACAAIEAAEGGVGLNRTVRLAVADGTITPREAREIVREGVAEKARLDRVIRLAERAA